MFSTLVFAMLGISAATPQAAAIAILRSGRCGERREDEPDVALRRRLHARRIARRRAQRDAGSRRKIFVRLAADRSRRRRPAGSTALRHRTERTSRAARRRASATARVRRAPAFEKTTEERRTSKRSRRIAPGPITPFAAVSGGYGFAAWYGAGGGEVLYERRTGAWHPLPTGDAALSVREAVALGVPRAAARAFGLPASFAAVVTKRPARVSH